MLLFPVGFRGLRLLSSPVLDLLLFGSIRLFGSEERQEVLPGNLGLR